MGWAPGDDAAIDLARGSGVVKRVQLEVPAENEVAGKLYERLGFVAEGVRKRAFWKPGDGWIRR